MAVRWLASAPWIRRSRRPEVVAAGAIGCIPLIALGLEAVCDREVGWFLWTTAAIYSALIIFMLLGAVYSWGRVISLGPGIDLILDEPDREKVSKPLGQALAWQPQALAFAGGVVVSVCVGVLLSDPLGRYAGNAGLAYDLTIGWTGGIGALTVYWLWGAPALIYPLASIDHPNLDWLEPLHTRGVQEVSRLMIDSSRLAAIGLLLFTVPIAMTLALASRDWSVWVLSVSPVVLSLITVLACSFLPHISLDNLIRRGRTQTLRTIKPYLPTLSSLLDAPEPEIPVSVELYERIARSPGSVVDWKRLLEYCLLLLSSVVPIGIALLSS